MTEPVSMNDVYQVIVDDESEDYGIGTGAATTYRAISRRLGREETDRQVHDMINAMAVSGYIVQGPLGAFYPGPNQMPAASWRRREYDDALRQSGIPPMTLLAPAGEWPNGPVEVRQADLGEGAVWFPLNDDPYAFHIKAANDHRRTRCHGGWLRQWPALNRDGVRERFGSCCDTCSDIVRRNDGPPSAVIPGADEDPYKAADRQQAAADRELVDRLAASEAAGNMVNHRPEDACSLGLWHEGPCPDAELERQLDIEDRAEDRGMDPNDRDTCSTHRKWFKDCVATDQIHSNRITRFNWCDLHRCAVHTCRCWTPNLAGRPLAGDEPHHTDEDWVDWILDPRVHSDGLSGGLSVDTRHGIIRVLPHPDGQWRVEGPYSKLRYFPTRHQGMLAAVDNEVHPDAVHRPAGQRTSAVVPGAVG